MTTIGAEQRTAIGRHRRGLEVIPADAPAGAAVIVAGAVPAAACGPPLHVRAASDETFLVLSGVLLVRAGGQVTAIPKAASSRRHPAVPARFPMLHTLASPGNSTSRRRPPRRSTSFHCRTTTSSA
jgi:hypothetical protein